MHKNILILCLLILPTLFSFQSAADDKLFRSKICDISFFSSTPVEDIDAVSKNAEGIINPKNNKLAFSVKIVTFEFKKKLMQEHFNENYLESDKYPKATFIGEILEKVNLEETGIYKVNVKGKLNMHGVEKERTISGTLENKNGELFLNASFQVPLSDHKIKVPRLVIKNIAEVIDVKISGTFAQQ